MGRSRRKVKSRKALRSMPDWRPTSKPAGVGGEIDGEPALRTLAAQRIGDLAPDRVDLGHIVEPHALRHRDVDLDELGAADLGGVAGVGLEAAAGYHAVHDAANL